MSNGDTLSAPTFMTISLYTRETDQRDRCSAQQGQ